MASHPSTHTTAQLCPPFAGHASHFAIPHPAFPPAPPNHVSPRPQVFSPPAHPQHHALLPPVMLPMHAAAPFFGRQPPMQLPSSLPAPALPPPPPQIPHDFSSLQPGLSPFAPPSERALAHVERRAAAESPSQRWLLSCHGPAIDSSVKCRSPSEFSWLQTPPATDALLLSPNGVTNVFVRLVRPADRSTVLTRDTGRSASSRPRRKILISPSWALALAASCPCASCSTQPSTPKSTSARPSLASAFTNSQTLSSISPRVAPQRSLLPYAAASDSSSSASPRKPSVLSLVSTSLASRRLTRG